jgi:hypothetical protein
LPGNLLLRGYSVYIILLLIKVISVAKYYPVRCSDLNPQEILCF